mgnify:CR=1 FL=1
MLISPTERLQRLDRRIAVAVPEAGEAEVEKHRTAAWMGERQLLQPRPWDLPQQQAEADLLQLVQHGVGALPGYGTHGDVVVNATAGMASLDALAAAGATSFAR